MTRLGIQFSKIPVLHRLEIKKHIFDVLQESSPIIQRQMVEIIAIISKKEYLLKWKEVIVKIKQQLSLDGGLCKTWALQLAKCIFKRYRFEVASNHMWSEIDFVSKELCNPLTNKFESMTIELTNQIEIDSIMILIDIFGSLIIQELPEPFVKNLAAWMFGFKRLLNIDQQAVVSETIFN